MKENLRRKISFTLSAIVFLYAAAVGAEKPKDSPPTPANRPTTQPTTKPKKEKKYQIAVNERGEIFLLQKEKISIKDLIRWLEKNPRQKIQISIHPQQKIKGELIKTLLKELKVKFQVVGIPTSLQPAAKPAEPTVKSAEKPRERGKEAGEKGPQVPPAKGKATALPPKEAIKNLEALRKTSPPKKYFWQSVPLRQPREFDGAPHYYEIRAQLVDEKGNPLPKTPLGIILYRNGKRERFGVFLSTEKGLFRLKVPIGVKGKFRISAIHQNHRFEFDLPAGKPNRIVYARFALLRGVKPSPIEAAQVVKEKSSKEVIRQKTEKSSKESIATPPAPAPAKGSEPATKPAPSKCNWSSVKLWSEKGLGEKKDRVELRIKFKFPKDRVERALAVVLARQRGKKLEPFIQARTDGRGCIRLAFSPEKGGKYFIASLLGLRPAMFPLKLAEPFEKKKVQKVEIPLASEKFGYISFNRLDAVVEVSKDEIRVTHILEFDYRQPPAGESPPQLSLPLAENSKNIQFDKKYPWLQWELRPGEVRLKKNPPPGRIRLAYASFYPRRSSRFTLKISTPQEIFQTTVYLAPEFEIPAGKRGEKIKVGAGAKAREFYRINFDRIGQKLILPLKIKEKPKGVFAAMAEMKAHPNKKFKLYGLWLLFATALAGIFVFFITPKNR